MSLMGMSLEEVYVKNIIFVIVTAVQMDIDGFRNGNILQKEILIPDIFIIIIILKKK